MSVRVYVPCSWSRLREILVAGGIGPAPVAAHAVTDGLRSAYPDGDEEAWEYAAMTAAAQEAIGLVTEDDPPRRVVVAMDAESTLPVDGPEPSAVEVDEVVPLRKVAAVHVDSEDAEEAVAAAVAAWEQAQDGEEAAIARVDRCLDHELGWFAPQELDELLG
jgi:hypothetical protein